MQDLIVVVLKTIAKFLAELPADVAEFFIEAQKSLFFGTLVSQVIIFPLLVTYMILRKTCKRNRSKLARIIERFPFYIWVVFFAGYISFFYDAFIILPFLKEKPETIQMAYTVKVAICFASFNILMLYFVGDQETETKRISLIIKEVEKEKDEKKKLDLMEEYRLNEQTCRKEMILRRYRGLLLTAVGLICTVAGIGSAFFEIVGGVILGREVYMEFGIVAVIVTVLGTFLWVGALSFMEYDDSEETVEREDAEKWETEVLEEESSEKG